MFVFFKPRVVTNIALYALSTADNHQLSGVCSFKPRVVPNTVLRALSIAENPQLSDVCFFSNLE